MEKKCALQSAFTITILICLAGYCRTTLDEELPELDFYTFFATDINDNIVSFEKYRGEVSLVVNVASECGYTDKHYRSLNTLVRLFKGTGKFNVLAFPCNQFGHQEPGTLREIYDFAYNRMGALFPVFSKIDVKGEHVNEAWSYLIEKSGRVPNWNFWKYLVNHKGQVTGSWGPTVGPDELYQLVEAAIEEIDSQKYKDILKKEHEEIIQWSDPEEEDTNYWSDPEDEFERDEL